MNTPEDIAAHAEAIDSKIKAAREARDWAIVAIDIVFSDTSLGTEVALEHLQEIDDALSEMIIKKINQIEDEDDEEW